MDPSLNSQPALKGWWECASTLVWGSVCNTPLPDKSGPWSKSLGARCPPPRTSISGGYKKAQELPGIPVTLSFGQEVDNLYTRECDSVRVGGEDTDTHRYTQRGRGRLSPLRPCSRGRGGVWISSFLSPAMALPPPPPQYMHLRQEPRPWPAKIKALSSRAIFACSPDFSEKDYGTIFLKYHRPYCTVLHDSPGPRRNHSPCLVSQDPSYPAIPLKTLPPQLPDTGMPLPSSPNTIPGRKGPTKIQGPIRQISMQKLISTPQNRHYQRLHTCSSEDQGAPVAETDWAPPPAPGSTSSMRFRLPCILKGQRKAGRAPCALR